MFDPVIFREYDIRGVYNGQFDKDFAFQLGKSFSTYLKQRIKKDSMTVAIGYDARVSSPEISESLKRGFNSSGINVVELGMVTTPMCYYSTFTVEDVDGAVMVTGSHNPPDYNGFKISFGKQTIFGEEIQKLRVIMQSREFDEGQGTSKKIDIFPAYLARYKKEFGTLKDVKVVLDCGNGAAGVIAKKLFNTVGLNPIILFEQPDGTFPNHHPDPTVEKNLTALRDRVLAEKAICGIGFDGDADRIGVVDEAGRMVYGDELMVVISRDILSRNKGAKIIGDVKCSDRLFKDVEKNGGIPVMWKTGHSLVKEKIKVEKAPFGGEMSGHIFFADRNYGYDDAPYAGLRLVEILSRTGKTINQLLEGLPSAFNTPEIRVDTTEEKKVLIVEKIKEHFVPKLDAKQINLIDGIRISFSDGWALCRSSNTQPVLVLRYESETKEGLERIQKSFEDIVNKYL